MTLEDNKQIVCRYLQQQKIQISNTTFNDKRVPKLSILYTKYDRIETSAELHKALKMEKHSLIHKFQNETFQLPNKRYKHLTTMYRVSSKIQTHIQSQNAKCKNINMCLKTQHRTFTMFTKTMGAVL